MKSLHISVLSAALLFITQVSYSAPPDYPGANGQPFQALQEQIDDIQVTIDARLADLEAQLQQLEAQVATNSGDIAALQEWQRTQDQIINLLRADVDRLEDQVMSNSFNLELLQEWTSRQEQMLSYLYLKANWLQQQISDNDQDIAALLAYDSVLQQMIETLQFQITALQLQVQNNAGNIATLQNQIAVINSQISSLQADLASKQNLITGYCGTGYSISRIYSSGSVSCEYDNGNSIYTTRANSYIEIGSDDFSSVYVSCPSNYTVTGGGFHKTSNLINVYASYQSGNGWYVSGLNEASSSRYLEVYATCTRIQ